MSRIAFWSQILACSIYTVLERRNRIDRSGLGDTWYLFVLTRQLPDTQTSGRLVSPPFASMSEAFRMICSFLIYQFPRQTGAPTKSLRKCIGTHTPVGLGQKATIDIEGCAQSNC
jgi:hypothetical protein